MLCFDLKPSQWKVGTYNKNIQYQERGWSIFVFNQGTNQNDLHLFNQYSMGELYIQLPSINQIYVHQLKYMYLSWTPRTMPYYFVMQW
jgi:hypothetical protein